MIAFLLYAVLRLGPRILELNEFTLSPLHWLVMVVFVVWMAWAEGFKGFYRAFSPRVIARSSYLGQLAHPVLSLFAPLFCVGFFYFIGCLWFVCFVLTGTIVGLVMLLRITPQPWRGIIDAGVVTGLTLGIVSLLYYWLQVERGEWNHPIALDLPGSDKQQDLPAVDTVNQER